MQHQIMPGTGIKVANCVYTDIVSIDTEWLRGFIRADFDEARVQRIVRKTVAAELEGFRRRLARLESGRASYHDAHPDEFVITRSASTDDYIGAKPHPSLEEGVFRACDDSAPAEPPAPDPDTDFPVRVQDRSGGGGVGWAPTHWRSLEDDFYKQLMLSFGNPGGLDGVHECWRITHVAEDWEGWNLIGVDDKGKRSKITIRVHPEIESESAAPQEMWMTPLRGTGG